MTENAIEETIEGTIEEMIAIVTEMIDGTGTDEMIEETIEGMIDEMIEETEKEKEIEDIVNFVYNKRTLTIALPFIFPRYPYFRVTRK